MESLSPCRGVSALRQSNQGYSRKPASPGRLPYSVLKPLPSKFRVRLFTVTVRTTFSCAPFRHPAAETLTSLCEEGLDVMGLEPSDLWPLTLGGARLGR